jgi:metal-responsive CopG/Arc/MetJ family transcriptional regulator
MVYTFTATDKLKVPFTPNVYLVSRINDLSFENRIESKSEAIRRLLKEALKKYEKKTK